MEAIQAVDTRRAVREYTGKIVNEATVRELIEHAILAPSAVNEQPWCFSVIQDPQLLHRLSQTAKEMMLKNSGAAALGSHFAEMLADPDFDIFYNAGTLIVIWAHPVGAHPDWDCCFAAENIMIAARGMGLGTCPVGFAWSVLSLPETKKELNVPDECSPVVPIIVGHPSKTPPPPSRRPAEITCWVKERQSAVA